MPKRAKRPTRKRRKRPTKRASAIKKLKQTAKEAVKAGLTPGQIAGIVVGGTAVAGLGTAAAVLAARDPQNYADYKQRVNSTGDIDKYPDNFYEKLRGYRQRYKDEAKEEQALVDEFNQARQRYKDEERAALGSQNLYRGMKAWEVAAALRKNQSEQDKGNSYGKRGRRRRKKRKFGGSCSGHGEKKFGKKVSKKPSAALRRMCKRLKVRLTVKRGKKRVYKSEKVLKKQCKNAMKKQ